MAATRKCSSCSDLQENSAEFVVNGVTDNVCNSLKNNTGFNPSSGHNDCDDLDAANDCLIGNMEDEVDSYEVCDWKVFMPTFIHNLWSTLKAMICSICGLWTHVEKHDCEIGAMVHGVDFKVGEDSTDGSYVAAGKGVSFLGTGTETGKSQITLRYIAGGLCRVNGTIICYKENFTDTGTCTNFDNGTAERVTSSRKGNDLLDNTYTETHSGVTYNLTRRMVNGGELLYEIRILKSQYPMIRKLFGGHGFATGGGDYHVRFIIFDEGKYAYGNHGDCNTTTGEHRGSDHDDGHLVPSGWLYVQCRINDITYLVGSTTSDIHKYTPMGYIGIRLNGDELPCNGDDSGGDDDEGGGGGGDDPTPSSYTVGASAVTRVSGTSTVSTTGGTVSPVSQEVNVGGSASITASAKTGYTFRGWATTSTATSYISTSTTYSVTPTGDATYYAIFEYTGGGDDPTPEPTTYNVGITSSVGGTATGFGTYNAGETVTLTAIPNSGYNFSYWTINGATKYSNPYSFQITEDVSAHPVFTATPQTTYTVNVYAETGGRVSTAGGSGYHEGDTINITATPNSGYSFNGWVVQGRQAGSSNPLSFTVTSAYGTTIAITARFVQNAGTAYTVSLTHAPAEGGSTSGGGSYTSGSTATVRATASSGYSFTGWWNGSSLVSDQNPYSFTVTQNITLKAAFLVLGPTRATETASGTIPAGETGTLSYTLTHTPASGTSISVSGAGGHTFTAGTSDGDSSGQGISIGYDGNKTITLRVTAGQTAALSIGTVTYYYYA